MGAALIIGLIYMLSQPLPADFWVRGEFSLAGWFATFAICAVWQISFAPYTSDYSRYLPASVGIMRPFIYTWLGGSLGTILAFMFGLVAVSLAGANTTEAMDAVRQSTGWLGAILLILFLLNIIFHNGMNLYGGVLSVITAIQTFLPRWTTNGRVRILVSVILLIGSALAALAASDNFISYFINLVLALIAVLIPWSMINLIDFYVIKKHRYNVDAIFSADGGCYGLFNRSALIIYFIGILVQIPFMENTFFTGPYARIIPGADISWVISLVVTGMLYSLFYRHKK